MPPEPEDPDAVPEEIYEEAEPALEEGGVMPEEAAEEYAGEPEENAERAEEYASDQVLQPCPNCAALLDVTDEEPFAQVHCPMCGTLIRARTQLKNFSISEMLGTGGMGAVYKALDVNLNRLVALKVVRKEFSADAEYLAKFEREARITASVNHPHVVKVFSFGSDHGLFYIAMELVDKGSLDDLMSLQGRVAEAQILQVGIQISQGLQAAHNKGLIHRDVKPGNILFAEAHTAKMVDFGLALLAAHEAEERGEVWGTPYYVAPEKLAGEPEDFRSDIYSLGGTLFHALAGRPPFEAETASLVALKHIKSKAVSLQAFAPDISCATAFVINRMLHKDPAHRYQTYDELIEHLHYAHAQLLEAGAKPRQKTRVVVESARQQNLMGVLTLILIVLMLAGGGLVFAFRERLFKKAGAESEMAGGVGAETGAAARYQSARQQIIKGDYAGADNALSALDDQPNLAQPLQNWITLHEGFLALLTGRGPIALVSFKTLATRGIYSDEKPVDQAQGKFFTTIGRLASTPNFVPPSAARDLQGSDCGALGFLILAIKDWELGRFSEASELLHSFLATDPKEPFAWIAEYKPLAEKYAADFAAYEKINVQIKEAKTPPERAAALEALQQLSAGAPGKMAEQLATQIKTLTKKFFDLDKSEVSQLQHDTQIWNEANAKFVTARARYEFRDGLAAVQGAQVTLGTLVTERAALLKKAQWLDQFKTKLINDINTAGYPDPIEKKVGGAVLGGVKVASPSQLEVRTPYGFLPIAWVDLPPATIFKMAQYFAQSDPAPLSKADRNWLSGVFAFAFGMTKEGRALTVDAAQTKPEYRDSLALFIDSTP